jgi:hypothetical protein
VSLFIRFISFDFCSITFRDEIAGCSEKAYDYLSINDARQMLLYSSDQELLEYIKEVCIIATCHFFFSSNYSKLLTNLGVL